MRFRYHIVCIFLFAFATVAEAREDQHLIQDPPFNFQLLITDSLTEAQTPARVRITQKGKVLNKTSLQAIKVMYGLWDHADGYDFLPDSSFYVDGILQMPLEPGTYEVAISRGLEYIDQKRSITIRDSQTTRLIIKMKRWINMENKKWYSGDNHIHIRRSPKEDPALLKWMEAENINVGILLKMGDFWSTYYDQYAWGDGGAYGTGNTLIASGQEDPRTPELGHAVGIGASKPVRYPNEYYLYDKVFDSLHALGGLTGYAHQAESFHGYRGFVLDALRNKVDMLEILQFCVSENPLQVKQYYHLLDLGFPITAIAGSDFPWCGNDHSKGVPERNARIGNVRFYTRVDSEFNYRNWLQALRNGNTFVTSGPMLELQVNGQIPGSHLDLTHDSTVSISAFAYGDESQVPLQRLEIISHGNIIGTTDISQPGQNVSHLSIKVEVKIRHGQWIAARTFAGKQQVAHTTPVYVTLDGHGFHNPATVSHYLRLSEQYLDELAGALKIRTSDPEKRAWYFRKPLSRKIKEVKDIIDSLKVKLK
jgi:hypothetical protein